MVDGPPASTAAGSPPGTLVLDYARAPARRRLTAASVLADVGRLCMLVVVAHALVLATFALAHPHEPYRLEELGRRGHGTMGLALFAADLVILALWQHFARRRGRARVRAGILLVCGSIAALAVAAQVGNLVSDPGYPRPVIRPDNFRPAVAFGVAGAAYAAALLTWRLAGRTRRPNSLVTASAGPPTPPAGNGSTVDTGGTIPTLRPRGGGAVASRPNAVDRGDTP